MPLTCPACREGKLTASEVHPLLPTYRCERCKGQWIQGEHYYRWLDHPDRKTPAGEPHRTEAVHDSARAMICPQCGKLLSRYRVGHGLSFCIDRCAGCGGIWLDADEWQSLEQTGLSDRIHLVFSTAWQAHILREAQEKAADDRLRQRIGPADFYELKRITGWIRQHPHASEISAYLLETIRSIEPRRSNGE